MLPWGGLIESREWGKTVSQSYICMVWLYGHFWKSELLEITQHTPKTKVSGDWECGCSGLRHDVNTQGPA